jgi:hypothetical protein
MVLLRCDIVWSGAGVVGGGLTQLYFQNLATEAQACVDATDSFLDALRVRLSNTITAAVSSDVPVYAEATGALLQVEVAAPNVPAAGALSGDMLPPANQALIRWQTSLVANNRVVKGKTFVPGIMEIDCVPPGVPSANLITAANAARDALLLDGVANFGIWHRPISDGGDPPVFSGGLFGIAESGNLWSKFSVLRSRRD